VINLIQAVDSRKKMNKNLIVLGLVVLLLIVGLSGCTSTPNYIKFKVTEHSPYSCLYYEIHIDGELFMRNQKVCDSTILDVNEWAEISNTTDLAPALIGEKHNITFEFYTKDSYWLDSGVSLGEQIGYELEGDIEVIYYNQDNITIQEWK